jgi:predicted metal-dependent hydrolase
MADPDPRAGAATTPLEYTVRRSSRARRARLTVTPSGEAVVVLPMRAPAALAGKLLEEHGIWLRRHMSRAFARNAQLASRPSLGAGRTLTVAGVPHDVVVEPAGNAARGRVVRSRYSPRAEPDLPRSPRSDILQVKPGRDGQSSATLLETWLRREARDLLLGRVAELAPTVGVVPSAVTIRGQRARWGSASRTGRISLNWRLILAPPAVLDYVVIHELAHLRVPGHSRAFWALVRRHAPDPDGARRWLREHHGELLAALD